MKNLCFALFVVSFISCGSNEVSEKSSNQDSLQIVASDSLEDIDFVTETSKSLEDMAQDGALFQFHDFKLLVDTLEVWSESRLIDCQDADTTWISLGLGYGIADRTIQIFGENVPDLTVHQSYETSVTVMNEGPHCDLSNWKHYNSDWEELIVVDNKIQTIKYEEKEWEVFIPVEMDELIEEVRKNCGDEWAEHTSKSSSPTDYPCGVGVNAIYLRIQYTPLGFDEPTTKYLAFDVPMGC